MKDKKTTIVVLMLLLITAFTGCTSQWNKDQAGVHKDLGTAYLNSAQYNPALKEFLQAEDLYPEDPQVHYYLGMAYAGKGLHDKAIASLKKAISLKPDFSHAYTYLGSIYNYRKQYDEAIECFNKALEDVLYDAPAAALLNMGESYFRKGDHKTAILKYREAIDKDPYTPLLPGIERNMGIVYYAQNDMEQAIRHFRKALELQPTFVECHYRLGLCYLKQGRTNDAAASFQAAIKLAPESEYGLLAKESMKRINR